MDPQPDPVGNVLRKIFAKLSPDPLTDDAGSVRPGALSKFGQYSRGHAAFAIPADEVGLAKAAPQSGEEIGSGDRIHANPAPWLLLEIDQQQHERATRPFRAPALGLEP